MLADVRMSWTLRSDEVMLFVSPEGLVVVAPLPDGVTRASSTRTSAPVDRLRIVWWPSPTG